MDELAPSATHPGARFGGRISPLDDGAMPTPPPEDRSRIDEPTELD
jgi:hypothetical protein